MKMLAAGCQTTTGFACTFLQTLFCFGAQFIVKQLAMTPKVPTLTKYHRTEHGFAIPIALGMGLVTLLLAMTAVLRSQDGRILAANTQAGELSQTAAETGIARIQNFLNRYRAVATYGACQTWQAGADTQNGTADDTCGDTGTAQSWSNPSNIPNINAVCGTGTNAESRTAISTQSSANWTRVDSADASKGEYRLVSYSGDGSLTIEGIVGRGTSNESKSVLTVTMPIFEARLERAASLWVKTSVSDNPTVGSDVIGPCTGTMSATPTSGYSLIRTQMTMPDAPAKPSTLLNTKTSLSGKVLPESGDVFFDPNTSVSDDEIYYYSVNSTALDGNFSVTGGKKIRLYFSGAINLQNRTIVNACSSAANCGPFNVIIYGEQTSGGTLTLNRGTAVCDVFFHLPNYSATFNATGSTASQDCGSGRRNTGIYWVNQWAGTGGSVDIPRAIWADVLGAVNIPALPPRIGPFQSWSPDA
jgi:Tfp pilus assembly protein PilX